MFCDDVELHAGLAAEDGEKAIPFEQTLLICLPVGLANLAPIAVVMAGERGLDFVVGHVCKHAGRGDSAAKRELFRRWLDGLPR